MTICKTCGYSSWCDCPKADDKNVNANELADEFTNRQNWKLINYIHWSGQSETMLRQQQAEIEALETDNNQLRKEAQEHALEYLSVCGQADEHHEKARQQQAEIEALKAKLNKYHLKEDLGKNLDLIYGKEFIK